MASRFIPFRIEGDKAMATSFPQWATPERREHLVKLFVKYVGKCHRGHPQCPDLRHYYIGCAFEHESPTEKSFFEHEKDTPKTGYTQFLKATIARLEENVPYRTDRERLILLAKEQKKLHRAVKELRDGCPILEHYQLHVSKAFLGDEPVERPLSPYKRTWDSVKDSWKAEDREARSQRRVIDASMLNTGLHGRYGREWDPVAKDEYHQNRPAYVFMKYGISAQSFKRVAFIRIPSTNIKLQVDISQALQGIGLSKNKRNKIMRYNAQIPPVAQDNIDRLCLQAVDAYWNSR